MERIRCPKCCTSCSPSCCTCPCSFHHWLQLPRELQTSALLFPLSVRFFSPDCVCVCVWYNPQGDPVPLPVCNPGCRLCECTEAEAEIILQLKNELREKELKLTDIRLEALSSAHHLDQIREAMNRMQVRLYWPVGVYLCLTQVKLEQHA